MKQSKHEERIRRIMRCHAVDFCVSGGSVDNMEEMI